MALRVQIMEDLLLIEFSGEVSTEDFRTIAVEVLELERKLPQAPDRLIDFSSSTGLRVDYSDIEQLAQSRQASPPPNAIKSAILCPRPVQFGLARIFQSLNTSPYVTVEIFRDRAAALTWLNRPHLLP